MGRPPLNRDTTVCISLSGRPSNHGIKFHNYLYEKHGLDYLYKAMTTTDIEGAIAGVRALGIRGCSVSMPFKQAVIPLMDDMDHSAAVIGAVNTIVNTDGFLKAYNTDVIAVASLLRSHNVDPSLPFLLRGSGGMAAAVAGAFFDAGFAQGMIIARNEETGRALAERYEYAWAPEVGNLRAPILVNVTEAQVVFDVVAMPVETPLIRAARAAGKEVIHGGEVIALQAAEQFRLYTGVELTPEEVEEAEAQAN